MIEFIRDEIQHYSSISFNKKGDVRGMCRFYQIHLIFYIDIVATDDTIQHNKWNNLINSFYNSYSEYNKHKKTEFKQLQFQIHKKSITCR